MHARPPPFLVTLDPPYRIPPDADRFTFRGWTEVADRASPDITLTLNGLPVPFVSADNPQAEQQFPGAMIKSIAADVDFAALFRDLPAAALAEPFLLEATVTVGDRARTFEYAVAEDWLARLAGRPVRALPVPPEPLQIRVAGAAAGGFHAAGVREAARIAGILARDGTPLTSFARVLDFGCGPGRMIHPILALHPTARLTGCDIDPEAIAWASENLGRVADFTVSPPQPPLPFADESFDLIYALSVFTHLPEGMQWGMLSELRRILRPGGVLLTTKLNPAAYDLPPAVQEEGMSRGFAYWGGADATDGLPGFYRLAYHTRAYVEREWGRYFEVRHVGAHDLNDTQDAVLMRRPRHRLSWLPTGLRKSLHRVKTAVTAPGAA